MSEGKMIPKLVSGVLIGLMIFMVGLFVMFGPKEFNEASEAIQEETYKFVLSHVPSGATDIKPVCDGWVEYTYAGHRYLFFYVYRGEGAASALTRIDW